MWREFNYNNKSLKPRRRQLRNRSTTEEKLLWNKLRMKKLGYKFVRQYSVAGYVIDFYCPAKRLAIEIDGGYHLTKSQQIYDNYRTRYIRSADIKEIRFSNNEIIRNIDEVIKKIITFLPS